MITRADVLAHLESQVRMGFLLGRQAYQPKRAPFVREAPSTKAYELYADLASTPWPRRNAGQPASSTDGRLVNTPTSGQLHVGGPVVVLGANEKSIMAYNLDWDVTIGIEHNAINDDQLGDIDLWSRSCGQRFNQHMDFLCFDVLANGESATPYGNAFDKQPLFSNSHADIGAEYQTVQSNKGSALLTLDNYETAKVAASKFKDDRGQPVGLNHKLLVHSSDLRRTAAQITDNLQDYQTTNRAINPYAGDARLEAPGGWLPTTFWGIVDPDQFQKPIILQIRQQPELSQWDDMSQGNGIRYMRWIARYTAFPGEWRTIYEGHN